MPQNQISSPESPRIKSSSALHYFSLIITVLSELHTDFSLLKCKSFTLFICGKTSPLVETPKIVVLFHFIKKSKQFLPFEL